MAKPGNAKGKGKGPKGKLGRDALVGQPSALWIQLLRRWHGLGAGLFVVVTFCLTVDWTATLDKLPALKANDPSTWLQYNDPADNLFHKFVFVHHESPVAGENGATLYRTGGDDLYFSAYYSAALLFVRYILRKAVYFPLGRAMGVDGDEELRKFAEQAWQVMYYATAWCTGAYVLTHTPGWDWLNMESYWLGYPHRDLMFITKMYYLLQLAFWISQIVVTLIEKWRKDFVEMMLHHIITSNLIAWSYAFNFTRMGIGILVEQDLADVFLPLAKLFKYAGLVGLQNFTFVIFTLTWIVTRHGIFFIFYYSAWTDSFRILNEEEHWDPENGAYYTKNIIITFNIVLTAFQCLLLFWLSLLIRAVKKALTEGDVDDERSGDEAEPASTSVDNGAPRPVKGKDVNVTTVRRRNK